MVLHQWPEDFLPQPCAFALLPDECLKGPVVWGERRAPCGMGGRGDAVGALRAGNELGNGRVGAHLEFGEQAFQVPRFFALEAPKARDVVGVRNRGRQFIVVQRLDQEIQDLQPDRPHRRGQRIAPGNQQEFGAIPVRFGFVQRLGQGEPVTVLQIQIDDNDGDVGVPGIERRGFFGVARMQDAIAASGQFGPTRVIV